jgi:polar amino acid transport system substrate-binding protein
MKNLKMAVAALAACSMMLAGVVSAGADETEGFDFGSVQTVSEGKLIVGTEAGFAPYEYLVGDTVEGVDMDIAAAIADKLGVKLEVQNMDFDGALLAVQQGKVDVVAAGVSVSEEREQVMDFSEKYVDSKDVVVVSAEKPGVEESSAEALAGKSVGVQQGNIADLWVTDNTEAKAVQRYTKFVQAAQDLANGKIDCIVMDEAPALELVESSEGRLMILEGDALFEDSYAIAIKKGNEAMKGACDAVISDLIESGEMDKIIASHSNADQSESEAE